MSEKIINVDIKKYDFVSLVKEAFDTNIELENLHQLLPKTEILEEVNFENDNNTWFHKTFYQKINKGWNDFEKTYQSLIDEVIKPIFKIDELIYQKKPTFRVQVPKSKSVGEFHRDYEYNHQLGEINFVLALTEMKDTATIWIESLPGLGDYHPINLKKGQMSFFNGNMCKHGNVKNNSGRSRVSFDFRILPKEFYNPNFDKASTSKSIPMLVGGYYERR